MSAFVEVPTATDARFRRRSLFWRPGMSVLVEPWVVLAETNTGHVAVPCGRGRGRAVDLLHCWHSRARSDHPVDLAGCIRVAAAVIDPCGDSIESWVLDGAAPPQPGGRPRWSPLRRIATAQTCRGCDAARHAGTWMAVDLAGCALCLPERERDDPRLWPVESSPPPGPRVAAARDAAPRARPRRESGTAQVPADHPPLFDSPSDGRLL